MGNSFIVDGASSLTSALFLGPLADADDLTNGEYSKFDANKRILVDPGAIEWKVPGKFCVC